MVDIIRHNHPPVLERTHKNLNGSLDETRLKSWAIFGDKMFLRESSLELEPGKVYTMSYDGQQDDACLMPSSVTLEIPKKVYGLQEDFIQNVVDMFERLGDNRSLGILLHGVQGTGKTITGKIISKLLNQPIILMGGGLYNGYSSNDHVTACIANLLSNIPQPVTVFFDEFEKNFGDGDRMLSLMDGTLTSPYKRMFIMTTNHMDINENFKQRPSRIRYVKKFDSLTQDNIEEIVTDSLKKPEHKEELMKLFQDMDLVTIDLVTTLIEEVNWTKKTVEEVAEDFNLELKEDQKKFFKSKSRRERLVEQEKKDKQNIRPENEDEEGLQNVMITESRP